MKKEILKEIIRTTITEAAVVLSERDIGLKLGRVNWYANKIADFEGGRPVKNSYSDANILARILDLDPSKISIAATKEYDRLTKEHKALLIKYSNSEAFNVLTKRYKLR